MIALTIDSVNISSITSGGIFSVKIPFNNGLNIIRAENSSGKSTIVNAIAYGLGLEAILGPSRKRPFPKSLYEVIYDSKKNDTPYYVSNSSVSIIIHNGKGEVATLTRDILGNDQKISIKAENNGGDYFLGSAGNVGSAISEKGFHHWLAEFIGWSLPNVVTFKGKITKLYLECIFPLFFIEQKRGWSEIQANTPTHYGIQGVKKSATEFCLAIDRFEYEKRIALSKKKIELASTEWEKIRVTSEGIADFNTVRVNILKDLSIKEDTYPLDFRYLENDISLSVSEQIKSLEKRIDYLSKEIVVRTPGNEEVNSQLARIRVLQRKEEKTSNSIESMMLSLTEVSNKLSTLRHDYDQYQQLRRLKNVGSNISQDLNTQKCPICENDLYDTLGNSSVKRKPMSLAENIDFLKNQLDFFNSIKKKTISQIQEYQTQSRLLKLRLEVENDKLFSLREGLEDINGEVKNILSEKIHAEILLRDALKLKESQNDLKSQINRVQKEWSNATKLLQQLRKDKSTADRDSSIRELESIIKRNLLAFNFNHSAINTVSISRQTLRPEQEGYDIVAETSASDYIRIIWAYTLALLELAGKEKEIKHGGFVVFDEPRQHEASKVSFTNLIEQASKSNTYDGQVIFATSLDEGELKTLCKDKTVNIHCFPDYILKLEKEAPVPPMP